MTARINFAKLVHEIVLDIDLLHWFATTGEHRVAVISAIAVARAAKGPHAAFDFLEQHIEDRR